MCTNQLTDWVSEREAQKKNDSLIAVCALHVLRIPLAFIACTRSVVHFILSCVIRFNVVVTWCVRVFFGLIWNSMLFNQQTKDENGRKRKVTLWEENKRRTKERIYATKCCTHNFTRVFLLFNGVLLSVAPIFCCKKTAFTFAQPIWANNEFEWLFAFHFYAFT